MLESLFHNLISSLKGESAPSPEVGNIAVRDFKATCQNGLHARPLSCVNQLAVDNADHTVILTVEVDGEEKSVDASSMLSLILIFTPGTPPVKLTVTGPKAEILASRITEILDPASLGQEAQSWKNFNRARPL